MAEAQEPSGGSSKAIKPINKEAIHRICSGQVVLDLATAVKELVENSLDARATSVEIRLKDYGSELIEVADNGTGIGPENYQSLTLRYYTSKISEFDDLQSLSSFGFRGEALSSLCGLANVSVVTRTKEQGIATRLTYDHSGLLKSEEKVARAVGTTVIIGKLFSTLPVRHKEFSRNVRREYGRLLTVLQAYALIGKGVKLLCSNQIGRGGRTTVVQTQGNTSVKDNIVTVFGTKTAACMEWVDFALFDSSYVEGFVSKPGSGCGRAAGDRQFFYINGRPVDMPKVAKLLNELYRSFNSLQYPMVVLNFILPTISYDVNVTPDKRKVFLHSEGELMVALRESLEKVYSPSKYIYAAGKLDNADVPSAVPLTSSSQLKTGRNHSRQDGNIEECESEEENASDDGEEDAECRGLTTEAKNAGNPSSVGRFSADIFAFQRPSSSSKKKQPAGNKGVLSRSKQATLSACLNKRKRDGEVNEGLLTEQPLLKRFSLKETGLQRISTAGKDMDSGSDNDDDAELVNLNNVVDKQFSSERVSGEQCRVSWAPTSGQSLRRASEEGGLPLAGEPTFQPVGGDRQRMRSDSLENLDDPSTTNLIKRPLQSGLDLVTRGLADMRKKLAGSKLITESLGGKPTNLSVSEQFRSDAGPAANITYHNQEGAEKRGSLDEDETPLLSGSPEGEAEIEVTGNDEEQRKAGVSTMQPWHLASKTKMEEKKEAALAAATSELERSFNKADFKRMQVLGQFNLGFILAKLDEDVFIVDQHASDEKYNFERLSKNTLLNKQPLLSPIPLELSASDEITVLTHLEVFRKNGFDFIEMDDAPTGQRLRLSAVPISQNVTFGVGDVLELISLVADEPVLNLGSKAGSSRSSSEQDPNDSVVRLSKWLPRPSRVRAMLASRACRSSVMIGDPLSRKEMERILLHLAELDSPWNCPHGRPTMRHLLNLNAASRRLPQAALRSSGVRF